MRIALVCIKAFVLILATCLPVGLAGMVMCSVFEVFGLQVNYTIMGVSSAMFLIGTCTLMVMGVLVGRR